MTNKAAAALARKRWSKRTAKQRSEHARMMAEARWSKKALDTGGTLDSQTGQAQGKRKRSRSRKLA